MQISNEQSIRNNNYITNFGAKIKLNKEVEQLVRWQSERPLEAAELSEALDRLSKVHDNTILELTLRYPKCTNGNKIILRNTSNDAVVVSSYDDITFYNTLFRKSSFVEIIEKAIRTTEFWEKKASKEHETEKNILDKFV